MKNEVMGNGAVIIHGLPFGRNDLQEAVLENSRGNEHKIGQNLPFIMAGYASAKCQWAFQPTDHMEKMRDDTHRHKK